ncbi:MAG: ExbD/TolR family protein [Candidatus Entotheonellia bacterium]
MRFRNIRRSRAGLDLTPLRALSISITPLVDTMLILLIFVLLSSAFIFQPGIRVRLPEAASKAEEPQQDLFITLTRDNRLYLNDEPLQTAELGSRLRERLRNRSEAVVLIKADKDVSHGRVVEIMDIANSAGAARLAIATEPKMTEPRRDSP